MPEAPWTPEPLLQVAAAASRSAAIDPQKVELLLGTRHRARRFASSLNNDGSPLQVCISLRARGVRVRLVGDPHADEPCAHTRATHTVRHCHQLARDHGAPAARDIVRATLATILPEPARYHHLVDGSAWLALAAEDAPGFALYLTLGWEPRDARALRARRWLRAVLRQPAEALAIVAAIEDATTLTAAALEGHSPDDMRFKLYFYLRAPMAVYDLRLPFVTPDAFDDFLHLALRDRQVDVQGLLLSVSFDVSGAAAGAKIDLCGHCLNHPPEVWRAIIGDIANAHALSPMAPSTLERDAVSPAFIGLALEQSGDRRLNIYLKEPQHAARDA
jgi:hypothetical protein